MPHGVAEHDGEGSAQRLLNCGYARRESHHHQAERLVGCQEMQPLIMNLGYLPSVLRNLLKVYKRYILLP